MGVGSKNLLDKLNVPYASLCENLGLKNGHFIDLMR